MIYFAIFSVVVILLGFYLERRFAVPALEPLAADARRRSLPVIQSHGHADFTCDRCSAANECDYAFADTNVAGVCAAMEER